METTKTIKQIIDSTYQQSSQDHLENPSLNISDEELLEGLDEETRKEFESRMPQKATKTAPGEFSKDTMDILSNHAEIMRQREKKEAIKAADPSFTKQNEKTREYFAKVMSAESSPEIGTDSWFLKHLNDMRKPRDLYKIRFEESNVAHFLCAAYKQEVESRGQDVVWHDKTKKAISSVARWMTTDKNHWGIIICGVPGTGKTAMARSIIDVVRICDPQKETMMVRAIDITGSSSKSESDRAKNVDVLVIDDIGLEPTTVKSYGNEISPVTEILYARYDNRLTTVLTTNLIRTWQKVGGEWKVKSDPVRERYGERIGDRMNEMFVTIEYGSMESFRK